MRLPRTARKAIRTKSKQGKAAHDARSSLANPKVSRHRDAVSARMGRGQAWNGGGSRTTAAAMESDSSSGPGLTREMLSQFDSEQRELMMDQMSLHLDPLADDEESVGGAPTFRSIASNLTQCTNASFGRVLKAWNGNSQQQNAVLAVLAGLTQVIREMGGEGTNMEYFALILNAVESFLAEGNTENLAATVYLLKLIISRVPKAALRQEFSRVSKNLVRVLSENQSNGVGGTVSDAVSTTSGAVTSTSSYDTTLAKSTLACLGILLRAQDDLVWRASSTRTIFQCLLRFIVDMRARVRKASHLSVISILKSSETKGRPHPASAEAVKYIISLVTGTSMTGDSHKKSLWALSLLGSILPYVSANGLQESCEKVLLPLMAQPTQPLVRLHAIRALHGLFAAFPSPERLPAERNAQLLTALYKMQPPSNSDDVASMKAWLTTARAGLANLQRRGRTRWVAQHLARLFPRCVELLASPVTGMHSAGAHAALRLLADVLPPALGTGDSGEEEEDRSDWERLSAPEAATLLRQLLGAARGGLRYQFAAAWPLVLRVMAALVGVWGRASVEGEEEDFWRRVDAEGFGEALQQCLQQLSAMRDERVEARRRPGADGVEVGEQVGGEHLEADLERVLGVFVTALGPEEFLRLVPLNMTCEREDGELDLTRSWVLPLLLTHGASSKRKSQLSYFFKVLRPIGEHFLQLKQDAEAEVVDAETPGAKVRLLETLYTQVWQLLPIFCARPVDLCKETFVTIEGEKKPKPTMELALKAVRARLEDRKELRRPILSGIRRLVACEKSLLAELGEGAVPMYMRRYAKNMVPVLFNLYLELVDTPDGVATIDAIREYLPLANADQMKNWYKMARSRISVEEDDAKRRATFDLMIAVIPWLPESELSQAMEEDCKKLIMDPDQTAVVQKKAYRILQEVVNSPSASAHRYVDISVHALISLVSASRPHSGEASQKPRLRVVAALVDRLGADASGAVPEELVKDLLAEALVSVKANNSEARRAAKALMAQLGLVWHRRCRNRGGDGEEAEAAMGLTVTEMLQLIMAGVRRMPTDDHSAEANHMCLVTVEAACAFVQAKEFRTAVSHHHVRQIVDFCGDRMLSNTNQTVARIGLRTMLEVLSVTSPTSLPLDAMMTALNKLRESHRRALRFSVKAILLKIMRRVGSTVMLECIPEYLRFPFVKIAKTELRKQQRQTGRTKGAAAAGGRAANQEEEAEAEAEEGSEEEVMDLEMQESGILPRNRRTKTLDELLDDSDSEEEAAEDERSGQARAKGKRKPSRSEKDGLWLEEAPGEVLDLMSSNVAQRIHTKAPVTATASDAKRKRTQAFPMSEDGRMIIMDPGDDEEDDETDSDPEINTSGAHSDGTAAEAPRVRPWRRKTKTKTEREPGEEYRSSRALGDMKRRSGPDPHAFLKLRGVSKKDLALLMKKKKVKGVVIGKGKLVRKKKRKK